MDAKTALYRLVSQGERLADKSLLGGFQDFQDWKGEVGFFFQALHEEFDAITATPVGIENGIRFLQKTFQTD